MTTLIGADGRPYRSPTKGLWGGHRGSRIYGRLDCPSAARAIARGDYVKQRVFFADEATAIAAGYRPCARCVPGKYRAWKARSEITALVALAHDRRATTITVGHARDPAAIAEAAAFAGAWLESGGEVLHQVDWPESAASWLRPARRFVTPEPDLWVVFARPAGWAQMARRLASSTEWQAGRTLAVASLVVPETVALAGAGVLDGLTGPLDGSLFRRVHGNAVIVEA